MYRLQNIPGLLRFPPAIPVYQIDELNHCLGSLSASLSERGWVNMLPMHERLSMGRPIVPWVRQVVNCLLFPHYLSVTWMRRGKGTPHLFTYPRMNRLCWLVAVSSIWHRSPVYPSQPRGHSAICICNHGFGKCNYLIRLTHPSWGISHLAYMLSKFKQATIIWLLKLSGCKKGL